MAPTVADITGLKDLVNQLQDRITKIEKSMKGEDATWDADRIRMILMGPPGAGT
jgi:adenylate kinase